MEKHLSAQEIGDRKARQIDETGLRMIDPTKQLGFYGDLMSFFFKWDLIPIMGFVCIFR